MRKIYFIFLLTLFAGFFTDAFAQSGGRKKEHRNQRKGGGAMFNKSKGNAESFAKGGGGRKSSKRRSDNLWVYKKTPSNKKINRETRALFSRHRTKGKRYRDGILAKQNASRAKSRVRGNKVFHKPKY